MWDSIVYRENTFLINFPFNKLFVWPAIYQCKYRRWQFKMQTKSQLDSSSCLSRSHSHSRLFCLVCLPNNLCISTGGAGDQQQIYTQCDEYLMCISIVCLFASQKQQGDWNSIPPFAHSTPDPLTAATVSITVCLCRLCRMLRTWGILSNWFC